MQVIKPYFVPYLYQLVKIQYKGLFMPSSLTPFFQAAGVAVIGASSNPGKLSFGILRNLIESNYKGCIYPVNPGSSEILGKACYPDISSVPDPIELAVIALPAAATPEIIKACGKRGIKAAIIISGGFKEVGSGGTDLEKQCLEIASSYQMRLIGPNCVGSMSLHSGLNTTFINGTPSLGGIGFVSQSGAICGGVIDHILDKKVGFSHFVSLGNEADVTETDILEYFFEDPNTRVIAAYVEQIRDGRRFLEVARKITSRKPIILLKAGRTSAGARAVSSHTGSLAGSHSAYQASFAQAGVIEVNTIAELFDIAMAFDFQPLPSGKHTVIITNAGGPAALASDSLSANGLVLNDLEEETKSILRQHLNPSAQVGNPVDMLGAAEPKDYALAVSALLKDKNVDIVLPILVPQSLVDTKGVGQAIVDASMGSNKPVLTCVMGDVSVGGIRLLLHENKIPMYTYPESMGVVLKAMLQYSEWLKKPAYKSFKLENINQEVAIKTIRKSQNKSALGEAETRPLLAAYGIPVIQGSMASSPVDAANLAQNIGFPVVMKIVSPQILHKSDIGGIRLNLSSAQEVIEAYKQLFLDIHKKLPQAKLEGVLIEQMAPRGQEVIIGLKRDPGFGPLIMFGLGGVTVELFKDVAFRIAPVSTSEVLEMIYETRAGRLLTGFRGQPEVDLSAVVDCIQRLGQMALDFPEIEEAEINPLLVFSKGKGAIALDGRVIF
jgi:acetate---CoA ligase (ADP-forming)